MADGGTVAAYIARVTAVGGGGLTLTLSTTAISGVAPTTAASGITATTGGAWKGPNAAVAFPLGFIASTLTNVAGDFPRVNLKNGTNYAITAAMTHANNGPTRLQGYTTTPGDGGRATIDGGASGASYILLTLSGANCDLVDLVFANNGATGLAAGVSITAVEGLYRRCIFHSVRGAGFTTSANGNQLVECEAYDCNQSNTALLAGFVLGNTAFLVRCVSHDNAGSNSSGFFSQSHSVILSCIADTNGAHGFNISATNTVSLHQCDSYNNAGDGIRLANSLPSEFYLENCNLVKNAGWGINGSGAGTRNGSIVNCAFGSGTQVNASGTTTGLSAMVESGSITYAANVTPWVDPANGDFRINLAAAKGTGRGSFTQTQASYTGTVAFPDVGAGQGARAVIVLEDDS